MEKGWRAQHRGSLLSLDTLLRGLYFILNPVKRHQRLYCDVTDQDRNDVGAVRNPTRKICTFFLIYIYFRKFEEYRKVEVNEKKSPVNPLPSNIHFKDFCGFPSYSLFLCIENICTLIFDIKFETMVLNVLKLTIFWAFNVIINCFSGKWFFYDAKYSFLWIYHRVYK